MIQLTKEEVEIRQFIVRFFLDHGFAPSSTEIENKFSLDKKTVSLLLISIAEKKALVLHPHVPEIWVAHPFANAPSAIWVQCHEKELGWWSPCPWCAFGIAALAKVDVRIHARLGGESQPTEIDIIGGKLSRKDLVIHMPIAVSGLWNNVICSCSMMLFHTSEGSIDLWCKRHRFSKGGVLTLEQCWEIAKGWYGDSLNEDWNRKSMEEVEAFFREHMLDLSFGPIQSKGPA